MIASFTVGAIVARTDAGVSASGKPFARYSTQWAKQLGMMGEATKVDLRLTGGLLASVARREVSVAGGRLSVIIAPDTGTSAMVRPARGRKLKSGRRAKVKPRAARVQGKRGPAHNVVGLWLHRGTMHMPARPWLSLTVDERRRLVALLLRSGLIGLR